MRKRNDDEAYSKGKEIQTRMMEDINNQTIWTMEDFSRGKFGMEESGTESTSEFVKESVGVSQNCSAIYFVPDGTLHVLHHRKYVR